MNKNLCVLDGRLRVLSSLLSLGMGAAWPAHAAQPEAAGLRFVVERFNVQGSNPLPEAQTQEVLAAFMGEQQGMAALQAAAKALEAALRQAGHGLYTVVLPPQEVSGSVQLRVVPRPLQGVAATEGADVAAVRSALPPLEDGVTPNLLALARALALANENPARQLGVRFAEAVAGGVSAFVDVQRGQPWSLSLRADNSGGDQPAPSRLSTTLTHANLWGLDHVATLSYTGSPEAWAAIRQYGLQYKLPAYRWAGSWQAYYFHSSSSTGKVADFFNVSGSGHFAGLSYTQHLLPKGDWRPSLQLAVDDKFFGDGTAFNGSPIGNDVRSRPLSLTAAARFEGQGVRGGLSLSLVTNLPGGRRGDDLSYAAVRAGAVSSWTLGRVNGDLSWPFGQGYALVARGSAQWTEHPLIGGEQFGLGGADSVRALETRQVMGDAGYQGSAELWVPSDVPGMTLLGFVDGGRVLRRQAVAATTAAENTAAAGVGVRWQLRPNASLSVDYARLVNGVTGTPTGHDRVCASAAVQF